MRRIAFCAFLFGIRDCHRFFDDPYDAGRAETSGGISDRGVFLFLLLASHILLISYRTRYHKSSDELCHSSGYCVWLLRVGQF